MRRIALSILIIAGHFAQAQDDELEIGQWRAHLPYNKSNSVSYGDGKVFCGSEAAFISYDLIDKEITRHTTISGLSDVGLELLKYNTYTSSLLVAYKNGNLDIIEGNKVINIASIKDANVIGDKGVYNIRFDKELAYLSCGFGIVVLNMSRKEVKDTYMIGQDSEPVKVNDVFISHGLNLLLAASEDGIYQADLDENLSDFNSWSKRPGLPADEFLMVDSFADHFLYVKNTAKFDSMITYGETADSIRIMEEFGNVGINSLDIEGDRLYVSKYYNVLIANEDFEAEGSLYIYEDGKGMSPAQTVLYENSYWVADMQYGLVQMYTWGGTVYISVNGPNTMSVNNIDIKEGVLWSSSGLLDPDFRVATNVPEFNKYENNTWTGLNRTDYSILNDAYGFVKTEINPFNLNEVWSGSWDKGLLEIIDGEPIRMYNDTNRLELEHTLSSIDGTGGLVRVGGLAFDETGNLWISNSQVPFALSVKTIEDLWYTYNLGAYVNDGTIVGDIIVTRNGFKWILLNRNKEIVVFDDNNTPSDYTDDRLTKLTGQEGNGNIPGDRINCFAEDDNGAIWIGTNEGPAVFYSPSSVFDTPQDAQRIFVEQDGQTQILLETENIYTIAVDGANRKWFGTTNSGAYLMSEDGTKQINHFTVQNSPIFSDDIKDIEINGINGEVFFCTSTGAISYKGSATEGDRKFGDVQIYPNPVQENYTGLVAIKGLAQNSSVKITDINGNLIYETRSEGGQATWDGTSITGYKARRGVYLVFSTDPSGEYQNVSKFLYLRN